MSCRNELRPSGEQLLILGNDYLSGLIHGDYLDDSACLLTNELPGNDVGVMLQHGEDYLITGLQKGLDVSMSHKVDSLGGASHEYDVVLRGCADEIRRDLTGILVSVGGTRRQLVSASVNVGVLVCIVIGKPVDDRLRALCGSAVVQPNKIVAVDLLTQYREIVPDLSEGLCADDDAAVVLGSGDFSDLGLNLLGNVGLGLTLRKHYRRISCGSLRVRNGLLLRHSIGVIGSIMLCRTDERRSAVAVGYAFILRSPAVVLIGDLLELRNAAVGCSCLLRGGGIVHPAEIGPGLGCRVADNGGVSACDQTLYAAGTSCGVKIGEQGVCEVRKLCLRGDAVITRSHSTHPPRHLQEQR